MADVTYTQGKTISSTTNWERKYRIKIYKHTQTVANSKDTKTYNQKFAQENSTDTVLDVSNLRIQFSITRIAMLYPNQAKITIYNLNAEMENSIVQEGYRVIVEAGYPANYGQIFDGTVIMCNRYKQSATDYILNIIALDGNQFLNEGFCTFSYAKGQTARQVVQNICDKASNPISLGYASPQLDTITYSKGATVYGSPKTTLADIARSINGTWFVDNGKLYMIAYSDNAAKLPGGLNQAVKLSPKTGLLGNPQQVDFGIQARCLLNPKIMPYGLISVESQYITQQLVSIGNFSQGISRAYELDPDGIYRVCSVTFTGDTRGNEWYADIVTVGQSGEMMSMLTRGGYTAN